MKRIAKCLFCQKKKELPPNGKGLCLKCMSENYPDECDCETMKQLKFFIRSLLDSHEAAIRREIVEERIKLIGIFHFTLKDLYGKKLADLIMKRVNALSDAQSIVAESQMGGKV